MNSRCFKRWLPLLMLLFLGLTKVYALSPQEEQHLKVALRTIGHQVLLSAGDSISRIGAIEKELFRYKIPLVTVLELDPGTLAPAIHKVMLDRQLADSYIVEIEPCDTAKVVYSYEVSERVQVEMIPCTGRILPKACYTLYITLLTGTPDTASLSAGPLVKGQEPRNPNSAYHAKIAGLVLAFLTIVGLVWHFRKKEDQPEADKNIIHLGDYRFDPKTMALWYKEKKTGLTGKEVELLLLLYRSENKVLERDDILNKVWGDQGDYVGRTLDVFMSKLRKKLAADTRLKIVNIRGVGYKFIVTDIQA